MRTALVLGGAGCVWRDIEAATALGEFAGVVACNDIGAAYAGEINAWVSLHPEFFPRWIKQRAERGLKPAKAILGHAAAPTGNPRLPACVDAYVDHNFAGQADGGSSGLFALKVALDLFDRAVLCGIPMTAGPGHFFNPTAFDEAREYRAAWRQVLPQIADRARSMGGWTAALLGRPSAEWIAGAEFRRAG